MIEKHSKVQTIHSDVESFDPGFRFHFSNRSRMGGGWKSQKLNFNRNLLQRSPDTVSVCVNFVSFAPANENLFWFFVVEIFLLFSFFFQKEREKMSP